MNMNIYINNILYMRGYEFKREQKGTREKMERKRGRRKMMSLHFNFKKIKEKKQASKTVYDH